MTDSAFDQNMVGGGEVMEVMMSGGDGGEMNEDTLAQVVNMLQMEGQLSGGNHTIIIRQPGSNEIQMIQTTSNGGELIVSKASESDIQALHGGNGILENVSQDILESQQGQMVMMDEGGNLVEGVVQMPEDSSHHGSGVMQLTQDGQLQALSNSQSASLIEAPKNGDVVGTEILQGLVQMDGVGSQNLLETSLPSADPTQTLNTKPITISTTTNKQKPKTSTGLNGEIVSIKVSTGLSRKRENKPPRIPPKNVIKISTVTGQQKYQPPKFHKCEACAINFVSKIAYMNHMENCPSKRKTLSTVNNKGNVTYTCVFCETKFTSRLVLMQHVRTCEKAKSSKTLSANSKLKVTTSESKLKFAGPGSLSKIKSKDLEDENFPKKKLIPSSKLKENKIKFPSKKTSILDPEDEPFMGSKQALDSDEDEDDEKGVVYDDEEDMNEEDLMGEDENIEETLVNKRSQKHLGPIIVKGMFKCRDCNRTFSKEYQYNRHVKACTNAPLNSSKAETESKEGQLNTIPVSAGEAVPTVVPGKRKRGRPPANRDYINDVGSPNKKRALGPKIVAVNPKRMGSGRGKPRFMNFSDNESDEDILNYLSSSGGSSRIKEEIYGKKNNKITSQKLPYKKTIRNEIGFSNTSSSLNKIVKISPTDTLVKQTGKAILSKMNKEKYSKLFKEMPFCGLCGDKFKTIQELSLHTQICHSEDLLNVRDSLDGKGNLSSVKCPLCDLYFVSPHILLSHMVSFHERDLKSVQEELESQNLNLVCPFCSELNLTQDLLKEHLATKHLDRLINKPSSTVSPMTLDVHAFIKEKSNGSILPTSKLLAKKEKVLCPECGLFFFKSYFEHHRCAAETYSLSARKFVCSESQCSGLSFYKLIHLLTHLQQVHEKSLSCKDETFDSVTQFLEWLKNEEMQTKMKFTKALQRMKQGKLSTVWICHRFHNAMKDHLSKTSENETKQAQDRLNQCYSRIHAETSFNMSTSRYDGKTCIKYYPDHHHQSELETKNEQIQRVKPSQSKPIPEKQPVSSLQPFIGEQSAFTDAAELKQLLEDDDDFEAHKSKADDAGFDAHQLTNFEELEKSAAEAASLMTQDSSSASLYNNDSGSNFPTKEISSSSTELKEDESVEEKTPKEESDKTFQGQDELVTPNQSLDDIVSEDDGSQGESSIKDMGKIINEEESLPSSELSEKLDQKDSKVVSGLVTFSDADLLLEKMLGEHDAGDSSVVPMDTAEEQTTSEDNVVQGIDHLAPTETKITDVDMLEAFGDCITPEESSNSTVSNTILNSISSSSEQPEQPELHEDSTQQAVLENEQESQSMEDDLAPDVKEQEPKNEEDGEEEEEEEEEEESTYVLPAGVEEWNKLFELVSSQVSSNTISDEEMEEAKSLLEYENKIMGMQIEKQIEIFNRLCSLANVQMN